MNHETAKEVLRLSRLSTRAEDYQRRALEKGDTARMIRAANLQQAAETKLETITMREVTTYSDFA